MKKLLKILVFVFILTNASVANIRATEISAVLKKNQENKADTRIKKLEEFLEKYNSPLAPYAEFIIKKADEYKVDWQLIPAISGVESTFGKRIPFGSFNAYGWCNGEYRFKSWENSIEIVTKTLAEKYYARGLNTPYKIAPVYAPPSQTWGRNVTYFINKLDSFKPNPQISL